MNLKVAILVKLHYLENKVKGARSYVKMMNFVTL